jgi:hypothetical protein
MQHFHRTHIGVDDVLALADSYFPTIGLSPAHSTTRERGFTGPLGAVTISARPEGGHYTFIEAVTDQMGESRLDRNVQRFFLSLHRTEDPTHVIAANY